MDFTVRIISRNLIIQVNFVEFRNSRIFTNFEKMGIDWTPKTSFLEKFQNFKEYSFKIDETETGTK